MLVACNEDTHSVIASFVAVLLLQGSPCEQGEEILTEQLQFVKG